VPGGFGSRGTRGMMKAAEYARTPRCPVFRHLLRLPVATVEFARNVCALEGADSTEVDENAPHKVIYKLRDLLGSTNSAEPCGSGATPASSRQARWRAASYGTDLIYERHRHRFEFNCLYEPALGAERHEGVGRDRRRQVRRNRELPSHPWYVSVQFHPEFPVQAAQPHPLFASFIEASYRHKTQELGTEGRTQSWHSRQWRVAAGT
jgi:CTP synthase